MSKNYGVSWVTAVHLKSQRQPIHHAKCLQQLGWDTIKCRNGKHGSQKDWNNIATDTDTIWYWSLMVFVLIQKNKKTCPQRIQLEALRDFQ